MFCRFFMIQSLGMDFSSINKASLGKYPTTVRLSALPIDENLKILKLRKIATKKFGEKLIADIPGHRCFFFTDALTDYLLGDSRQLTALDNEIKKGDISFKPLSASTLEFSLMRSKKCKQCQF